MEKTIQNYHQTLSSQDQKLCEVLYEIITRNLPATEHKIWHRHPVWFIDGNPVVGYSKLKNCVQLLFWSGQSFAEPELKSEGTFKAAEIRYTAPEEINKKNLVRYLQKAVEIQWDYKNIVKRKGILERLK